ncbi:hypothetical protein HRG84_17690 [Flavisolibacter sp. BT320]|nr:hypothetical protein [Flavisolibacter longurius]
MDQQSTPFFTFECIPSNSRKFVEYWSAQYDYPDMDVYEESIVKTPVTAERLITLFTWKNGMPLSGKKEQALRDKIISKLTVIQTLSDNYNEALFDQHFGKLRIVWRVFLLHIINPERFPIFDQHVYRAYRCLMDISEVGREEEPKLTMEAYNEYCKFYREIVKQCDFSSKTVDDALWAFGKFLSRYPWMVLSRTKTAAT